MRWGWPPWGDGDSDPTPEPQQQRTVVVYASETLPSHVRSSDEKPSQFDVSKYLGTNSGAEVRLARYLSIYNPYVIRYKLLLEANVLGPQGLYLQMTDSGVKEQWEEWTKVASLDGLDWVSLQSLMLWSMVRDGESMIEVIVVDGELRLYSRDVLHCARWINSSNPKILTGVRLDQYNRPVSYLFNRFGGGLPVEIPAERMIHLFEKEFPGQVRGITWLSGTSNRYVSLDEFEEAAVTNAKFNAAESGYVSISDELQTDDEDDPGASVRKAVQIRPGEKVIVPEGVEYKPLPAAFPATSYEKYRQGLLSGAAVGGGISYATLATDWKGANFSSLRQGRIDDVEFYRKVQRLMCRALDRIFREWMLHYSLTGSANMSTRMRRVKTEWVMPGHRYIDPVKETAAQTTEIKNLTKSHSEVIAESGRNPIRVFEKIAEDYKAMLDAGIPPEIIKTLWGSIAQEPEDEEDEEEREERREEEEENGDDPDEDDEDEEAEEDETDEDEEE